MLSDIISMPIKYLEVRGDRCKALLVPDIKDEDDLDIEHLHQTGDEISHYYDYAKFIETIVTHLKSSKGLGYIISDEVDGFSGSFPRIKQFLLEHRKPIVFLIIFLASITFDNNSRKHLKGILANSRHFMLVHSNEFLTRKISDSFAIRKSEH